MSKPRPCFSPETSQLNPLPAVGLGRGLLREPLPLERQDQVAVQGQREGSSRDARAAPRRPARAGRAACRGRPSCRRRWGPARRRTGGAAPAPEIDSITSAGAKQLPHDFSSQRWPPQRGQDSDRARGSWSLISLGLWLSSCTPRVDCSDGGCADQGRVRRRSTDDRAAEPDVLAAVELGLAGDELAGRLGREVGVVGARRRSAAAAARPGRSRRAGRGWSSSGSSSHSQTLPVIW